MYLQKIIYTNTVQHTFANFYIYQYKENQIVAFWLLVLISIFQVQSLCPKFAKFDAGKHPNEKGAGGETMIS